MEGGHENGNVKGGGKLRFMPPARATRMGSANAVSVTTVAFAVYRIETPNRVFACRVLGPDWFKVLGTGT